LEKEFYPGYGKAAGKYTLFNDNWSFTRQEVGTSLEQINGEGISWSEIDLPHDWLIYNTKDLYETGEGWYKKEFVLNGMEGRRISLCFEGVYMDSTVFINNETVGEWKYGYSSFEFDITGYLQPGKNEVKVRVVHQHPNSRWYSGAGIYRNVWLKTTAPLHLVTDGIYIVAGQEEDGWSVELETEVVNAPEAGFRAAGTGTRIKGQAAAAILRHTVFDANADVIAISENQITASDALIKDTQCIYIREPVLWNLDKPYLYTLKTELIADNTVLDKELQHFGLRTFRFDAKEGFFLNDNYVKLQGVNEHHDLGALGAAINRTALRRKFVKLKEMGVNAIRSSHNMPAVELMELADELGVLIISEALDMWERQKNEYDYARFFKEWYQKDITSWVRRDRNHPSILMWSIGNEIYDTHADERGLEVTKLLKEQVLLHDPKKNARVTIGSNYMFGENAQKCADEVKFAGYNYLERLYEEQHEKYPDWYILGSETGATVQSRGVYHFPQNKIVVMYEDEQCSCLDNCTTSWGVKSIQDSLTCYRDKKYTLGQFVWTGFDYIGEPTPYATKNSYYGQLDTAGFPKDTYYLYQAQWTDYKVSPMVHVFPYWDFNEGQLIDILVCSNAPRIELFFNEESVGAFDIDHARGKQLMGKWQLPYRPGILKAVAYDENGKVIATDIQSSFGDGAKILLSPDKYELRADGLDLIFMEISLQDDKGNPVANANNRVEVAVSGAGRLVGLDNGDSTDYDQYKGTSRRFFAGKLLAIVAARTEPGEIQVEVSSQGLPCEKLILKAIPCEKIPGVSALMQNIKSEPDPEIPVRKIELINRGTNRLDREHTTAKVSARILPENSTCQEIEWKAVTAAGIETNTVKIEVEDKEAAITALGDGEFRLRCIAKNGTGLTKVISELEFEISGMGAVTVNPYELIDAALYNVSNYELDNGLMGGINTRDGVTNIIGFRGFDFGDYGSDEVTLPICFWSNDPIPVEIWEGVPGEPGAAQLLAATYQADWIWATFLPNIFKLPRRLKGITTVCFVFYHKLNLQGIRFTYTEKALERLKAVDNNRIYGDSYTITREAIEHIGNNSSIEFDGMDFGEEGVTKLVICGRSHTDNTIHLHFDSEEGSASQSVEFPYTEEYTEKEFILTRVTGKQKVSFVFLPGCNFDFEGFHFLI
jgi:beta-galactosidase